MASRNQRVNSSKISVKCGQCKKGVKEDDGSAIGCKSCQIWLHGTCAHLSEEEVKCLGDERNYVWLCDSCVEQNDNIFISSKTEAKLNGLFDSLSNKFTSSIAELIPKAVKESFISHFYDGVKKSVNETIPTYADISSVRSTTQYKNLDLQFIINGVTESEDSYLKQIEKDSIEVKNIIWHMELACDGNVTGVKRLGKKVNLLNKQKRNCRPIRITTSNPVYLQNCFARSHYLQKIVKPVCITKFLISSERQEKDVLGKRFHVVHQEGEKRRLSDKEFETFLSRA